ncbi:MAG: amidohydrolase, partial [Anaerolineaceae bacterium]|nr:amidohydrolase [Anaerolineaceae bacterium]
RMREIAKHICFAHSMECDFDFYLGYPPTVNHQASVAVARQVMQAIVGEDNVIQQQPTMGAEDFAFMLQKIPGCYCFIGNGSGDHARHHMDI